MNTKASRTERILKISIFVIAIYLLIGEFNLPPVNTSLIILLPISILVSIILYDYFRKQWVLFVLPVGLFLLGSGFAFTALLTPETEKNGMGLAILLIVGVLIIVSSILSAIMIKILKTNHLNNHDKIFEGPMFDWIIIVVLAIFLILNYQNWLETVHKVNYLAIYGLTVILAIIFWLISLLGI